MDLLNKTNNQKDELKRIKDRLYGMDYKDTLQAVRFATTENRHLNEYPKEDNDE
jgi:hypothetical protein